MSDFSEWAGDIWGDVTSSLIGSEEVARAPEAHAPASYDNSVTAGRMAQDVGQYGAEAAGGLFAGGAGGQMTPEHLQRHYAEDDAQAQAQREADNAAKAQAATAESNRVRRL